MGRLRTSNGGRTSGKSDVQTSQPMTDKERRRLRRKLRNTASKELPPPRLTEASVLELAIALAQYFYYELDDPILTDHEYDKLEVRYIKYKKQSGSPGGILPTVLDNPGSGQTLRDWFTTAWGWRNK